MITDSDEQIFEIGLELRRDVADVRPGRACRGVCTFCFGEHGDLKPVGP